MFFHPRGEVFDYAEYLLKDISTQLDRLIIVCNGCLSEEGRKKLHRYSKEIINRPNNGFDAAAWKEAIVDHLGQEELKKYDELVLFNDSFFGPFRPFAEIFEEMKERPVDFWGLSSHGEVGYEGHIERHRYIQLYFSVIRKRMLHSPDFFEYWKKLEIVNDFEKMAENHQYRFTWHFEQLGYSWTVYSDTSDLESSDLSKNISHHMFNTYEMIAHRRFPVLKRKCFTMPKSLMLRYGKADGLQRSMDYIKQNTDYDTGLIWDYLLHNCNLRDIYDNVDLNRVIPVSHSKKIPAACKAAVIGYLYYEDDFPYYIERLLHIDKEIDVFLITDDELKKEKLEKLTKGRKGLKIITKSKRGRDLSALLVAARDIPASYDVVCFFHDKKSSQKEYATLGTEYRDLLIDNILYNRDHVRNIINTFTEEPRLGIITPPSVYHGTYFYVESDYWGICFEGAKNLLDMLEVDVPVSREKQSLSLGTCFWFRSAALKKVLEYRWKEEDFPDEPFPRDGSISHCLERIFPLFAQSEGYYTLTALNEEYAAAEITNFRYMMEHAVHAAVKGKKADNSSFEDFERSLSGNGIYNSGLIGKLRHSPHFETLKRTAKEILPYGVWQRLKKLKNK